MRERASRLFVRSSESDDPCGLARGFCEIDARQPIPFLIMGHAYKSLLAKTPKYDSKLKGLSREQREQVAQWIKELSYSKAAQRIKSAFGITVSIQTLSKWYSQIWPERLAAEVRESGEVIHDMIIQSDSPVRITILRRGINVSVVQSSANQDLKG